MTDNERINALEVQLAAQSILIAALQRTITWMRFTITVIGGFVIINSVNWLIDFITESTNTIDWRPVLHIPTYTAYVALSVWAFWLARELREEQR